MKEKDRKRIAKQKRCAMSNKIVNGNGKDVIFVEFAIDYVKKLGYDVYRSTQMKIVAFSIMVLMQLVLFSYIASAQFFTFNDDQLTLNVEDNISITQLVANETFNQSLSDSLYWRLDGTNSPPTANWDMGGLDFEGLDILTWQGGDKIIRNFGTNALQIEAVDLIYLDTDLIRWGTNTEPTVTYQTLASGLDGRYDWNATDDFYEFYDDIFLRTGEFIIGNGSRLTDVCLTNGTGCLSVPEADFTNVAYLNNTQTFQADNTFNGSVTFGSDIRINNSAGQNITWTKNADTNPHCFLWTGTGAFNEQGFCSVNNLLMEIIAVNLKIGVQTLQLGRNDTASFTFDIDTQGDGAVKDTTLAYQGLNGFWEFKRPITWDFNTLPVIIPSDIFPANNITFDNFFGTDVEFNNLDIITDSQINITNLQQKSTTSTSMYVCWDADGELFRNETGC